MTISQKVAADGSYGSVRPEELWGKHASKVMDWKLLGEHRKMTKRAGKGSRPAERHRGKQWGIT